MSETNNKTFLQKVISNLYFRNIILMIISVFILISITLFSLRIYTKHSVAVEVPNLKGLNLNEAEKIASSVNLKCEIIDSLYQPNGKMGNILEQIPKSKSKVKEGRTIYLTVQTTSLPLVAIPDLEDASLRQTQILLNTLGFTNIEVKYIPSEFEGLVYAVEYKGNKIKPGQKVPEGAKLTLKVGDGSSGSGIIQDSITSIDEEPEINQPQ